LPAKAKIHARRTKTSSRDPALCDSIAVVNTDLAALRDDNETLKAALVVARAEAAAALAQCSHDQALIAHLKLEIAKLQRDRFGPRSERSARLLAQMELQLEELEASATEDELAAEAAAGKTSQVAAFTRTRRNRGKSPGGGMILVPPTRPDLNL
jgi:peptidoglycan hydrolase CwlO-like protein